MDLEREIKELRNIAQAYRKRNHLAQAAEVLKTVLQIQERQLDANHPELALTVYQLGEIYSDMGRNDIARRLYHRAVAIWNNSRDLSAQNTMWFAQAMLQLQEATDRQAEADQAEQDEQDKDDDRYVA